MKGAKVRNLQSFEFDVASPSGKEDAVVMVEWSYDRLRAKTEGEYGFYNYDVWVRPFGGAGAYYVCSDTAHLPGYPASCIPAVLAGHIASENATQPLSTMVAEAEGMHLQLEAQMGRWLR